ncbi:hypothetical protein HDC35_003775 [Sphingopyxis sp. JAI128]|nr:hypothetical protein [Sphingopyxis sp. JAI128]
MSSRLWLRITLIVGIAYALLGSGPSWVPLPPIMRFWFRLLFPDLALVVWLWNDHITRLIPALRQPKGE